MLTGPKSSPFEVKDAPASAAPTRTILQIIPRMDTGGAEETTLEMVEAVRLAGGRALVVTAGGRRSPEIAARGGQIMTLPVDSKNPITIVRNALRLRALFRSARVDLVHARSRAPAWSALWAARMAGVPFVTTYHGAYNDQNWFKRTYNSVMARGDQVIANSRFTAALIAERHGVKGPNVHIIHRGVDLERFDPQRISPDRLAAIETRFGLKPGDRLIIQAARLTNWKGQQVVIAAASRFLATHPDRTIVFALAGDDQGRTGYARALQQAIDGFGIGDRVRLVGHCSDLPAAFLRAELSLVASIEPEAFGRVVAESLAMGCPVIASDIGAPPEVLGDLAGDDVLAIARLVPAGDADALCQAIAHMMAMGPEAQAPLRAIARQHVERDFSVRELQRKTLAVYDQLLQSTMAERFVAHMSHAGA